jgi:hypothetical protein
MASHPPLCRYMGAELITATLAIGQPDPYQGGHPSTHLNRRLTRPARTTRARCYTT